MPSWCYFYLFYGVSKPMRFLSDNNGLSVPSTCANTGHNLHSELVILTSNADFLNFTLGGGRSCEFKKPALITYFLDLINWSMMIWICGIPPRNVGINICSSEIGKIKYSLVFFCSDFCLLFSNSQKEKKKLGFEVGHFFSTSCVPFWTQRGISLLI